MFVTNDDEVWLQVQCDTIHPPLNWNSTLRCDYVVPTWQNKKKNIGQGKVLEADVSLQEKYAAVSGFY